jgi:hypothetical protein
MDYMVSLHFMGCFFLGVFWITDHYTVLHFGVFHKYYGICNGMLKCPNVNIIGVKGEHSYSKAYGTTCRRQKGSIYFTGN